MELNPFEIIIIVSAILVIATLIWFGFVFKSRAKDDYENLKNSLDVQKDLFAEANIKLAKKQKDYENIFAQKIEFEKKYEDILVEAENLKIKIRDLDIENHSLKTDINSLQKSKQEDKSRFDEYVKDLKSVLENANTKIEKMHEEINELKSQNSKYKAEYKAQLDGNQKLKEDLEEQSKKLELKIDKITQQVFEAKIKKFDDSSIKSLENILKPFKENLDSFKQKVEYSQEHSTKKFAELSKEIEQITKMSIDIGNEAKNLTQALKGKKQTQGRWGEMILESVLEFSGLIKGKHYETQESYRDESGYIKRPDVIVKLPQERNIIIDSKVSLNDYDRYIKADSDEQRQIAAKAVVNAFKNHINTLDSKDYSKYKTGTLQYIFMFVPIEGAFALAIQEDQSLYEYALNKHIAIVNPSTLTVSLRTIYLYWQSEQSTSNAIKMFDTAGKLYDKMVIFAESFNKIGNQIQTVSNSYESAKIQLATGNGNLMKKMEDLKVLGARTTKSLKNSKINYSDFDDEELHVEIIDKIS